MADFFGIGNLIENNVSISLNALRGTGRTTNMVRSLKHGDCVIVSSSPHIEFIKVIADDYNVDLSGVQFGILDPKNDPPNSFSNISGMHGTPQGRVIYDHVWIEEHYINKIKSIASNIDTSQINLGGYGVNHVETKRKYQDFNYTSESYRRKYAISDLKSNG